MQMSYTQTKSGICLFCGPNANSFERPEHPIPESLGNDVFILHNVVCDACNQYFSQLDNYFIHHYHTSPARLITLQETKKRKPPMQTIPQGEVRKEKGGQINFSQAILAEASEPQLKMTYLANEIILNGTVILADADAKRLSRFLAKCGLETLYIKRGALAFAREFTPLRNYARYGTSRRFIPFLWGSQTERPCDLLLATITGRSIAGIFYFATIFVPGSVYFFPLNRIGDDTVIEKLAAKYPLEKIMQPGLIKREPIRYEARWA